jgi:hypothetical protein
LPQIELAVGDGVTAAAPIHALVLRILAPLTVI